MGIFSFFKKKPGDSGMDMSRIPRHIGIIMDGNGRWARRRGLPRTAGHKAGADAFKKIVLYADSLGVEYMTVYAFSTENWKRPKEEVDSICDLLHQYIDGANKEFGTNNVRLRFIGDITPYSDSLKDEIRAIERRTSVNTGITVNIAINYGGRAEIVMAARRIAQKVKEGVLEPDEVDEEMISGAIYTASQPDPELIIRPSGEKRLSNFMLWQAAYSELCYFDIMWPDFGERELDMAIAEFQKRNRRFGGV